MLRGSRKNGTAFYCFSPPVMMATFVIEIALMLYVLYRYQLNSISRLAAAMLFFLALFQLAEYNVCGGMGIHAEQWSRIGFVAITMLPVLGVHLVHGLAKRKNKLLPGIAYATALTWGLFFVFGSNSLSGHECAGNYVIFQMTDLGSILYGAYYYGWLLIGMGLALYFAQSAARKIKDALYLVIAGYMIFLVPTALIVGINPSAIAGIPSIMCGFAVLFALILTFGILPRGGKIRQNRKETDR